MTFFLLINVKFWKCVYGFQTLNINSKNTYYLYNTIGWNINSYYAEIKLYVYNVPTAVYS